MSLILISGSGPGAGKSYLSSLLLRCVDYSYEVALADGIRTELEDLFPEHDWRDKTQAAKNKQFDATRTIRDMLVSHGQSMCKKDPLYWCKQAETYFVGAATNIITDIRKVGEVKYFKKNYKDVLHLHVHWSYAEKEPFDNEKLAELADYVLEAPGRVK